MSKSLGYVEVLLGNASRINVQGKKTALTNHVKLYMDDVISTGDNTTLIIKLANGKTVGVGSNQVITIDDSVTNENLYTSDEVQADVAQIQEILAEGKEIETSAGDSSAVNSLNITLTDTDSHKINSGDAKSTTLDSFNEEVQTTKQEDAPRFFVPLDGEAARLEIGAILTNDTTPTITGRVDDPTATITLAIDGNNYTASNNGNGTWSAQIGTPLSEGSHDISLVATDPAGNTTNATTTITIDTILDDANNSNNGNVVTIDTITPDTGSSTSDFITSENALVVSGTFDNEDSNALSVTVDDQVYTPTISGNSWSVDLSNTSLDDGTHDIIATVTDLAGNSVSTTQTVTVDTNANNSSTDNGNGNAADGSDVIISLDTVAGDDIINANEAQNNQVVLSGTTTAQDGAIVSLLVGNSALATTTVSNGVFSYTVPTGAFSSFSDATYTLRAEVVADKAGNIATATRDVVLDTALGTTSGATTSDLITIDAITTDTGVVGDFITNDTTLSVSGTYDSSNGNTLQIELGGITYTPTTGTNQAGDSTWSVDLPEISNDGNYDLGITISDASGNTQTITQTITVDTTADVDDGTGTGNTTAAIIVLDAVSEDNFLNANEAGNILTLSGTSNVIGAEVAITLNGNPFTSATVESNGTYSVDVDTSVISNFPDGEYNVEATIVTDAAGNSVSATQTVTLDTTLDTNNDVILDTNGDGTTDTNDDSSINVTIDTISDDTGVKDFITTDNTLIINGQFNAENANTLVIKVDSTIYKTTDTNPLLTTNGNHWTLDLSGTSLSTDTYTVTATVSDAAGNSESAQQNIQIVNNTNNNIINLDEISNNYINAQEAQETLTITGKSTEIGQVVNFQLNGNNLVLNGSAVTAIIGVNGSFSIDIPADTFTNYADGEYKLQASVVGKSNGIVYNDTENVFLDRTNNGTGGNGTGINGDDATITLNSVGDGFINAAEAATGVHVSGTTTAVEGTAISFITSTGETITSSSNGQAITANANGTYDVFIKIPNLSDGQTLGLTAQVIADKAGNIATSGTPQTLSIDLSAGSLSVHDSQSSVYEAALADGSAPSNSDKTTSGNIFSGDNIGNSTLSSFSANGVAATPWSENSSILTLQTQSGTLFIATQATVQNGTSYSAGDYVYVLENASSATTDSFTYTLSDPAGNSASADLNISIVDDVATVNADGTIDKYITSDTSGYATNLILTLDVSGSMIWDADGSKPGDYHYEYSGFLGLNRTKVSDYDESTIRIDLAKDALKNLIDEYAQLGDVNVQVISFSDTATSSSMLSAIDAKNYIDSLSADGATNYQAAMAQAEANPFDAYSDANTTQYYFISDGEPNTNISQADYTQWQTYIKESPIDKTFAIGVGDNVNTTQLNNISGNMTSGSDVPNEISGIDGDTIVINSITDLDATLIQTVNTTIVTGNLTSFDADGTAINLGADGGHLTQVNLYDQAGNISTTLNYDANNLSQTTTTDLGGSFTINFADGSYSYSIDYKANIENKVESFDVNVTDSDGVSVTNSVNIHIQESADQNFSYDGSAIDGGAGYDTLVLAGAQSLDLNNISNIKNIEEIDMSRGDNEILNINAADVLNMTDSTNELFISGDSGDNVTLDTTTLTKQTTTTDASGTAYDVYSDANATVTLNIEQEIVVS